jgi:glycosyltransferase involved in cell wall biosynthesis
MRISVIIPAYNASTTIAAQLDALHQQRDAEPFEIIVVDNASTDSTIEIVQQYQQKMPHLRIVEASARQGASYARNTGASVAQGNILLFCDADDEVDAHWVSAMTKALSTYDFVGGVNEFYKLNPPSVVKKYADGHGGSGVTETFYLPEASSNNLGIKRSIHEAVGGFDEAIAGIEDVDYAWCVQESGIKLHGIQDAIVHYRFRPSVQANFRCWKTVGYSSMLMYRKHTPRGLPKWHVLKGFLATGAIPLKFLLRVRDRYSLIKWWLNCGWCLGYIQAWFDMVFNPSRRTAFQPVQPNPLETLEVH